MASQEKIAVYNLADLKNTSDDAIPNYLNSLKFKQSHTLTDVRLALGYGAFAVSVVCFLWDRQWGFDNTKYLTGAAVALYAALNGALSLWMWKVEGSTVYTGTAPSGEKITISTTTRKNVPEYNITISVTPAGSSSSSSATPTTITVTRPFTEWFDGAGHFVAAPFQSVFATAVPVIGNLDPKRVMSTLSSSTQELTPDMLDAVLAASATGSEGTGTGKKGGKRRKA